MKKNANILLRMHTKEARAGITRTSPDHTLGTVAKVFYIIAFIWTMIFNLLYLVATAFTTAADLESLGGVSQLSVAQQDEYFAIRASLIFVGIGSAMLIAALVCLIKKWCFVALPLSVIPAVTLCFHFAVRMDINLYTITLNYILFHLVPLLLLTISAAVYCAMGIAFTVSENRAYTRFVDAIYRNNSADFDNMTEEEWDAFLSSYDPSVPKKCKKKKKVEETAGE